MHGDAGPFCHCFRSEISQIAARAFSGLTWEASKSAVKAPSAWRLTCCACWGMQGSSKLLVH